jgi:hypothetical protein
VHWLRIYRAMTELSYSRLEPLWENGESVLFRGVRAGDRSPILVETPALAQPAPESLQRLEWRFESIKVNVSHANRINTQPDATVTQESYSWNTRP